MKISLLRLQIFLKKQVTKRKTVWSEQIQGSSDIEVLELCRAESRIMVTLDMDFSDIRKYKPEDYRGIILLRIASQSKRNIMSLFKKVIPNLGSYDLIGHLWIVQKDRIRIRGPGK